MTHRALRVALGVLLVLCLAGLYMLQAPRTAADTCEYFWSPNYRAKLINGEYQCGSGTHDCTQCENDLGDKCAEDGMKFCKPEGFLEKTMSP